MTYKSALMIFPDWNEETDNKFAKKASRTDTQTAEKPEKSPTFWNKRKNL